MRRGVGTPGARGRVRTVRLLHTCSEPTVEGSAPEMHSRAIADGLGREPGMVVTRHWRSAGARGSIVALLRYQVSLVRQLKEHDVVYMRWHVLDLPVHLAARLLRRPLVLEVNGRVDDVLSAYPRLRRLRPLLEAMARVSFRIADRVVTVSPGLECWVGQRGPRGGVSWVHNGAPAALAAAQQAPTMPPRAVFVGHLATWQGLDVLLQATRSPLWPTYCQLDVVGDGPMEEAARAEEAGGRVIYHGRLPRHEAIGLLARATVSVSPQSVAVSRNHVMGMPLKVMESIMLGVPVVGSALPQQESLLRAAPGCRVFYDDSPEELADAVRVALSADPPVRPELRAFGRAHASWDDAVEHARDVILSGLLDKSTGRFTTD